jgi:transcriptional regulator with XRE-family HTH domain
MGKMGLNIKNAIKRKGLTSIDVAKKMGITTVGLSQHINGNPSIEVLTRIAEAIGVDISELFEQPAINIINCPNCGAKLTLKKG